MKKTAVYILQLSCLLGGLGVLLGAFGAHGLKKYVPADGIAIFGKAVHYQFIHVLALLALGIVILIQDAKERIATAVWAFYCFLGGILCFSGSLYLIILLKALAAEPSPLFIVVSILTPVGGVFFVLGWIFFFLYLRRFLSYSIKK